MNPEQTQQLIDMLKQAIDSGSALGTQLVQEYAVREQFLSVANIVWMGVGLLLIGASLVGGYKLLRHGTKNSDGEAEVGGFVIMIVGGAIGAIAIMANISCYVEHQANAHSPTYSIIKSLIGQ